MKEICRKWLQHFQSSFIAVAIMAQAGTAASQAGWKAFEASNAISTVDDNLFKFDAEAHKALLKAKPWRAEYVSRLRNSRPFLTR